MKKVELLRLLADRFAARSYLEIGIKSGATFFAVPVRRKLGVDPWVRISRSSLLRAGRRYPPNLISRRFEETSDEFFERRAAKVAGRKGIDLVFIDGRHAYEQVLADARRSLAILSERGVIVLHDANPATLAEAWPADSYEEARRAEPPGWNGSWCGDSWKAVLHLRAELPQLGIRTVASDSGLAVVSPRIEGTPIDITPADVPGLSFADLDAHRDEWLSLCDGDELARWIEHDPACVTVGGARASRRATVQPTGLQGLATGRSRILPAQSRTRLARVCVAATMAALALFVALPEAAGDRPYDPHPSAWISWMGIAL